MFICSPFSLLVLKMSYTLEGIRPDGKAKPPCTVSKHSWPNGKDRVPYETYAEILYRHLRGDTEGNAIGSTDVVHKHTEGQPIVEVIYLCKFSYYISLIL